MYICTHTQRGISSITTGTKVHGTLGAIWASKLCSRAVQQSTRTKPPAIPLIPIGVVVVGGRDKEKKPRGSARKESTCPTVISYAPRCLLEDVKTKPRPPPTPRFLLASCFASRHRAAHHARRSASGLEWRFVFVLFFDGR